MRPADNYSGAAELAYPWNKNIKNIFTQRRYNRDAHHVGPRLSKTFFERSCLTGNRHVINSDRMAGPDQNRGNHSDSERLQAFRTETLLAGNYEQYIHPTLSL
jgi:hypothetical protein